MLADILTVLGLFAAWTIWSVVFGFGGVIDDIIHEEADNEQ